jgi:uroporphyrinogen-III synthase
MTDVRRHRALITRPQEDAADVAVALARRGITPVLAPMMRIVLQDDDVDRELSAVQALLFTSRNGVRAFCRASSRRDLPALAVGDSTAALARDNGFLEVHSAGGDSDDLARLAIDTLNPSDGSLFHAAGETIAGTLFERLTAAGFTVVRRTLYDAVPVDQLSPETQAALQRGTLDYVLLFSPRTARVFVDRVRDAELDGALKTLTAVCLSPAVAAALDPALWRAVEAAPEPTTAALISVLDRLNRAPSPTGTAPPPAEPVTVPASRPEAPAGDKAVEPAVESRENAEDAGRPPPPFGPWAGLEGSAAPPGGDGAPPMSTVPAPQAPLRGWVDAVTSGAEARPKPEPEPEPKPKPEPEPAPEPEPVPAPVPEPAPGPAKDEERGVAMSEPTEKSASAKPAAPPPETKPPETKAAETRPTEPKPTEPLPEFLSASASSPPPRRRGASAGVAWTLVVVLAGLGAAYLTLPQWRDRLPEAVRARLAGTAGGTAPAVTAELAAIRGASREAAAALAENARRDAEAATRLAAVEGQAAASAALAARLAAAEAEIAALKNAPPQQAGGGPAVAALVDRLAKVEAALEAAGKARGEATAAAAESDRRRVEEAEKASALVAGLQGRIASLEESLKETRKAAAASGHADALALAVGQLREALSRPSPFAAELATLEKVAGDAPALPALVAPLRAHAGKGIPTRSELFVRLPDVVDAAVAAARPTPEPGYAGRIAAKLRDFVSVRRIDGKGSDAEARIARAERAAGRGDLAAAVAELAALQGGAADAVAAWLGDARARLAADDAAAALGRRLLAGAAGEPGK